MEKLLLKLENGKILKIENVEAQVQKFYKGSDGIAFKDLKIKSIIIFDIKFEEDLMRNYYPEFFK